MIEAKSAYTKDAIENDEDRARNTYAANKMSLTLNKYVVIAKVQPVKKTSALSFSICTIRLR